MMAIQHTLAAVLLWPGLVGGALLAWFYLWLGRKLTARWQGRRGPRFYQPFFDFVKLLGKTTVVPRGVDRAVFYGLPLAALVAVICALALIPAPGNLLRGFSGDLVLLLYLLEVPALCLVLAGYASRSIYGQVGAAREAVFALGYNLPFVAALIALAVDAHSFDLAVVAGRPFGIVQVAAGLAFLLALPARLRSNPFSIPNAEQEILAGAWTEFNGAPLAFFELAHGLELVALVQMFGVLFLPFIGQGPAAWVVYLLAGALLVALLTLLAVATARLKIQQAFRLYWQWGAGAAAVSLALSWLIR